jgi:hypothetical protein
VITVVSIPAGNLWTRRSDLPGSLSGVSAVTGISVGGKGYFFQANQLWEYTPAQNLWVQKKQMPAEGLYAFGFAGNNKIYIGYGGYTDFDSVKLWEYDIATDNRTKKKKLPISPRIAPFGFSINNTGYVGGGQISFSDPDIHAHDFWKYNTSSDTWSRMADFAGKWTIANSSFIIGSEAFVYDTGLGFPQAPTAGSSEGKLWRYDALKNEWAEKAQFQAGKNSMSAVAFSIGGRGYLALALNKTPTGPKEDFWMYDPAANAWTKKADVGGSLRWFSAGFAIGNKGYVGLGTGNTESDEKRDFWEYSPE